MGGGKLRKLALLRLASALQRYTHPWEKRVLLRLIYVLKACLRPAPVELLRSMVDEPDTNQDFAIQLAKQAAASPEDLAADLAKAVSNVFGDKALVNPVLAKCGISE